jgi:peptide/nickel transport system substrate-binding protein
LTARASIYLPSPLTGWLVDRYGRMKIAAASGIVRLSSVILAALATGDSIALLALTLALLGVGWNFGLVSGTAIITDTVPLATRAKTRGLVDVSIAIAGATGGMASGIMVAATGYPALTLTLTGGILSLALLPAVAATAYRRWPLTSPRIPVNPRLPDHGTRAAPHGCRPVPTRPKPIIDRFLWGNALTPRNQSTYGFRHRGSSRLRSSAGDAGPGPPDGEIMKMCATRLGASAAGVTAAALVLASCAGGGGSAQADADRLDIATLTAAQSLDPADALGSALPYFQAVYDTLVKRAPDGGYQPMLASEWAYNSDRTELSLTLRKGVKFSDGTVFDAAAVKANMEHFRKGGGGGAKYLNALKSVKVVDSSHVTLELSTPDPALLFYLSDAAGLMASPAKLNDGTLKTTPVGTGPYTLDQAQTAVGDKYVFARKQDYWGDELPFKTLTISVFDNETAVVNGLKTGQIDSALLQDANQQKAVSSDNRLTKTEYPFDFQGLLLFDRAGVRTPALREPKVRQAISYALDRTTMLDKLRQGRGEVTDQIFGPQTKAYDKGLDTHYSHDPAKAKRLLAEAGYAKGFTLKLPRISAIVNDALASSIETDLKAVGIKVVWDQLDPSSAVQKVYRDRAYSAMVMNIGQSPIDWVTAQDLVKPGTFNMFGSSDATVQRLLATMQTGTEADAAAASRELNEHLVQEGWFAPFYRMQNVLVSGSDVKAVPQSGMSVPSIYNYTPAAS